MYTRSFWLFRSTRCEELGKNSCIVVIKDNCRACIFFFVQTLPWYYDYLDNSLIKNVFGHAKLSNSIVHLHPQWAKNRPNSSRLPHFLGGKISQSTGSNWTFGPIVIEKFPKILIFCFWIKQCCFLNKCTFWWFFDSLCIYTQVKKGLRGVMGFMRPHFFKKM